MKSCINGATTMPYSLEQDVAAAARAGFEGVEIWWDKLVAYLDKHSVSDLKQLLDSSGVIPTGICPLRIWPFRDSEPARQEFRDAVQLAPHIGCQLLAVCPDFQPARLSREEALAIHAKELSGMARLAADKGIRLTVEPIGGHTLVPGPSEALQLIEMAGAPANVGILMDTFHYFRSGVSDQEIEAIPLDKLDIVHVNDCQDGALNELTDAHRLYPTLGVIPARQLSLLKDRGYDGYLSVEIFRPEYWKQPIEEITGKAYTTLGELIASL
ncbi:MAG: sugar phosphate isomerase/epimerase [Chloroflexi bacterium]|nr:sugar phosphate isomerase/epimerase [Chloroflexota bacterium]